MVEMAEVEVFTKFAERPKARPIEPGPGHEKCRCGRVVSVLFTIESRPGEPMCSECVRRCRAEARNDRKDGKSQ
jgi:hypothetical protein